MIPVSLADKYHLERTLYQSAATTVYLVRHRQLEEYRILKSVSLTEANSSSILKEANLLAGLHHPGIPIIYDIEYFNDSIVLVEEFISGTSLAEFLLYQNKFSKKTIIKIVVSVCEIIEFLHSQNPPILYRDMKPEHIYLDKDRVRLIDYGIATSMKNEASDGYGTKSYAAPEQLKGEVLDKTCDVYGIGMILKELSERLDEPDIGLKTIIKIATASDRTLRYSSVTEMKHALTQNQTVTNIDFEKKHLISKIAVIGSDRSVGCTHIAIALTVFLNSKGIKSYYTDTDNSSIVKKLSRTRTEMKLKDGVIYHENFYGFMKYGEAIESFNPPSGVEVLDCGFDINQVMDADISVYVTSGNSWHYPDIIPAWISNNHLDSTIVVMNFPTKGAAINLAKRLDKKVYTMPMFDAFSLDKDIKKIMSSFLHQIL